MIVIGSYPVQHILGRKPKDLDMLATLPDFQKAVFPERPCIKDRGHAYVKTEQRIYDCELIWPDTSSFELAKLILNDPATVYDEKVMAWVPSLNILYMLKMSHRFKKNSPHFLKTMRDIQLMRAAGAVIQPEHEEFYKLRMKETYSYAHPNLNTDKKDFFRPEDNFYIYDHDSIHETVALSSEGPAYTRYAVDGEEVLSSKEKFFAGPECDRIYGVYEEACVLALERSQIPHGFKPHRDDSFKMALMKVCTSITSGWFREFAWENYDHVMRLYDFMTRHGMNYVDEFSKNAEKLRKYERIAA